MGNHTLELTPTKGAVVLGQLADPAGLAALFHACFPGDSTRLDSWKFGALNQFTQEPEEHQQQREEGCGSALLRAEKQNWLSQQSELSDQPFHLTALSLWVECDKHFFWQLSFKSWHCCLVVPAQLCVMTTCWMNKFIKSGSQMFSLAAQTCKGQQNWNTGTHSA